jgi:hypothetical protein
MRMTGKIRRSGSMVEQFGIGLGASVADPIVAELISPDALLDLLQNGRPSGVFSDNFPSIHGRKLDALGNIWRAYTNSELGIARFFITVPVDKPPEEILLDPLDMETLQCGPSRTITGSPRTGNIKERTTVIKISNAHIMPDVFSRRWKQRLPHAFYLGIFPSQKSTS